MDRSNDVSQNQIAVRNRIPLILSGLGLVLLLVGIVQLVADQRRLIKESVAVPPGLAGMPLTAQVYGRPALAEIEQMHGKGFLLVDGAVGHYGEGAATVWISGTWVPFLAARQVEDMRDRIAEGRSPFEAVGSREMDGTTIYVLVGMGQMHYYFQVDQRVVWLAASPELAEQCLQELLSDLK